MEEKSFVNEQISEVKNVIADVEKKAENIDLVIEERKKKIAGFLKKKTNWIAYIVLGVLVYISVFLRTRNLNGLKDVTRNSWTLGPDLDPFLFLRYAKYIVENGALMVNDIMRYVPLGYNTAEETRLLPYMMAYLHKLIVVFSSNATIEYSAVIFPVVMFALTAIAFFFMTRKLFDSNKYSNWIAGVSTFFLIVSPSLLSRTVAGIPEKESAGFFFLFAAFYFFVSSWKSKKMANALINSVLAGAMTACMGLIWGGFVFIFLTISVAVFLDFLFGKINNKEIGCFAAWMISSILIMMLFSERYSIIGFVTSTSTGLSFAVLFILVLDKIIFETKLSKISIINRLRDKKRIPREIISIVLSILGLIVIAGVVLSPSFIVDSARDVIEHMIHPFSQDRFSLTVAENRQPYFSEWMGSFGPVVKNIPLFFWLFFFGSIFLFYEMLYPFNKREKMIGTLAYSMMLVALIFSRYSSGSQLNGVNSISQFVYFGGFAVFAAVFGFFYFKNRDNKKIGWLKEIDFSFILVISLFFLSLVAARGGVRLIMMLAPPASIIIGYFSVMFFARARENRDEFWKTVLISLAVLVVIITAYTAYHNFIETKYSAASMIPSSYTQQWQKAMAWVRDNTPKDAVFAHWWDYGYWLQTIGERATVLDGGNAIVYWNHLMGRHVLTGPQDRTALEYLYTHNATHLLIDSSDIGKYPAYSSIGSDENYDRMAWIPTFLLNEQGVLETANETHYYYEGGFALDEDYLYSTNETQILFPSGSAGIGRIVVKTNTETGEFLQPEIIMVYQGRAQSIPLRYVYYKDKLYDFKTGMNGCAVLIPRIYEQGGGVAIDQKHMGAAILLSNRTFSGLMGRLFIISENNSNFKLVRNEPNLFLASLRANGLKIGDFAYFHDVLGPIKIWEIVYPSDINARDDFLLTRYPDEALRIAKMGY